MAKLGKCLCFYFKYPAEMDTLYWEPREAEVKPVVVGLEDAGRVLSMVERVGDAACQEVADFLETCAERIERQLQSVGAVRRRRKRVAENWEVEWVLCPRKRPNQGFCVGVYADETLPGFVPWVWCRGRKRAEDELFNILQRGEKGSAGDLGVSTGTIILDRVRVAISDGPDASDVEQEPLIEAICQRLTLTEDEVAEMGKVAKSMLK